MLTEPELLQYLQQNNLPYEILRHPAVFTCAEAEEHRPARPSVSTKNLFLCDKKARRFLLAVTACEKTASLESLSTQTGIPHLRFASPANLLRLLGVTPGSVTMMGLVNDTQHEVALWIDGEIWDSDLFQSHPLVNTATLLLSRETLLKFFALTGHSVSVFK